MEPSARFPTPESALQDALSHLQIRTVVQETIQSMLVDVELAVTLSKDLLAMERQNDLQKRAKASEIALQEARLLEEVHVQKTRLLADELVKELWSLSKDIGALKQWKDQHQPVVDQRDELIAKLMYAEDENEMLKSKAVAAPAQGMKQQTRSEDARFPSQGPRETDENPVSDTKGTASKEVLSTLENKSLSGEEKISATEQSTGIEFLEDTPLVMMLSDDEDTPALETLEVQILMKVFTFLDAVEILNLAQVNVAFFSRVDSLFGSSGEGVQDPPIPTVIETTFMTPTPTIVQIPPNSSETSTTKSNTPSAILAADPGETTMQSPGGQGKRGIFALLQSRSGNTPRIRGRTPPRAPKKPQPITDAMISKLSDVEVGAIITMRDQLIQRDREVAVLLREKEDLFGKLEGTEAVKQFLIGKVREVEQALSKSQEDESRVTQQIASDQEVIAFLDGRVNELERNLRKLSTDFKATQDELNRTKNQNSKKITVLGDMLQFEREQSTENDREWKATKKLLVKEVKNCRSQITALQAERDGYREQNARLRKAVLSNGVSNGSPSKSERDDRY